jgi:hypothetical protein
VAEVQEVSFSRDIRQLFRDIDIAEMNFILDLTDVDDVREFAEAIHTRLADGTMPCDEAWPDEHIQLFRRWIDGGALP